jgi:hypothetical protein
MTTATPVTIDLGNDETVPLTPVHPNLGPGFAAIVAEIAGWDDTNSSRLQEAYDAMAATEDEAYEDALENVDEPLTVSHLNQWPCTAGDPEEDAEAVFAGPYIETIHEKISHEAANAARAVLARDFGLITEADFAAITGPWVAAGFTLQAAREGAEFAVDQGAAVEAAKRLGKSYIGNPGWPLAVVTS